MKIKRKVEMTHEEYAKYMIDKFGIASYENELIDNNIIDATMEFEQTFTLKPMRKDDNPVIARSFNGVVIEVEENVTEDTVFETLIKVTEIQNVFTHIKASINEINHDTVVEIHALINGRLTLIWRDGKLVE